MIFRQLFDSVSSTYSYVLASRRGGEALIIDPVLEKVDRYLKLMEELDLKLVKAVDTHLHADHITGLGALRDKTHCITVMGEQTKADVVSMRLADGEQLTIEGLALDVIYTPGHTDDSYSFIMPDRVFTGDTLLIRGTGRTDFQNGDPRQQYESIFGRLLKLPNETLVYPAHDYKGRTHSTIGAELADNPRLWKRERAEFVAMMQSLDLSAPTHLTEALRTNMTGAKPVSQLLAEAAAKVAFVSLPELAARIGGNSRNMIILDLREREAFESGHIPGAVHLPRGQLELRVNSDLPDPTAKILTCCEFGKISTLAAATLRELGYGRAVALDGGMQAWREARYPLDT
jgi:glyoxylase-like metal-dependent hydrolase (beta-lactamase superfamily II)/rhodanese-related sulfurtransferase